MKPSEAAEEMVKLAEASARLGGPRMSAALEEFLQNLASSPGLRRSKKRLSTEAGNSPTRTRRVGARLQQPIEGDMSKTIEALVGKLREAFYSDDGFEGVLADPQAQALPKSSIVTIYNLVFDEPRPLARSLTKPEVFNAIRRERIKRVRAGY